MKKAFFVLSNLILLALCVYAIHDMQTSQGVGYYFALKFEKDRLVIDIITDVVFVIFLIIAVLLPSVMMQSKQSNAQSRFFILFVALIPTLRTDYVFNLFFTNNVFLTKFSFDTWAVQIMNAFAVVVPFLVLVLGWGNVLMKEKLSGRNRNLLIATAVLIVFSALVPGLSELLLFIGAYLLIFVILNVFETGGFDSLWLYGFLFVAAVYRIISVTAAWS